MNWEHSTPLHELSQRSRLHTKHSEQSQGCATKSPVYVCIIIMSTKHIIIFFLPLPSFLMHMNISTHAIMGSLFLSMRTHTHTHTNNACKHVTATNTCISNSEKSVTHKILFSSVSIIAGMHQVQTMQLATLQLQCQFGTLTAICPQNVFLFQVSLNQTICKGSVIAYNKSDTI